MCSNNVYFCIIFQWLKFASNTFFGGKEHDPIYGFLSIFESSKAEVGGKGQRTFQADI